MDLKQTLGTILLVTLLLLGTYSLTGKPSETKDGRMIAASAIMTLPIIVLFFFIQRTFIQGVKMTGLKG